MPANDPDNVRKITDYQQQPTNREPRSTLKSGDGGGTYDGMDGWQASVEARLGELKTELHGLRNEARGDFRLIFGAIIAASLGLGGLILGLAGLMAKGFHWF